MSDEAATITLATELTVAWLANPNTRVSSDDVPAFLAAVHGALGKLSAALVDPAPERPGEEYTPAVSVRKSLASPDRIVSMIDGKPCASLKRHLAAHGLTPDQYRERYGLKRDYPMVAPGYSAARSEMSKRLGLGRKPGAAAGDVPPQPEAPASKKARGSKAAVAASEPAAAETKSRKRLGIAGAKAAAKEHLGGAEDA